MIRAIRCKETGIGQYTTGVSLPPLHAFPLFCGSLHQPRGFSGDRSLLNEDTGLKRSNVVLTLLFEGFETRLGCVKVVFERGNA